MVRETGLEPARLLGHMFLKHACLPFQHSRLLCLVPKRGLEPPRSYEHTILNRACLPISALRPTMAIISNPDRYIKQALQMRYNSFMEKKPFIDLSPEDYHKWIGESEKEEVKKPQKPQSQIESEAHSNFSVIQQRQVESGEVNLLTGVNRYGGAKDTQEMPVVFKKKNKRPRKGD